MKKQSIILHFLLFFAIFLYCFMPPVFTYSETPVNRFPSYSLTTVILSLLWTSVALFAVYNQKHDNSSFSTTGIRHFINFANIKFQIKFRKCIKHYKSSIIALLLILFSCFLLNLFVKEPIPEIPSKTPFRWFVFFVLTCFFAASEEILYRYYLPRTLRFFIDSFYQDNSSQTKKICIELSELFAVLLFALAHRYLGFAAVIHAFISGAILRWNIKKTDTLISVCLIHSLYNCLIFCFYLL